MYVVWKLIIVSIILPNTIISTMISLLSILYKCKSIWCTAALHMYLCECKEDCPALVRIVSAVGKNVTGKQLHFHQLLYGICKLYTIVVKNIRGE
jgi:hypothetical protein